MARRTLAKQASTTRAGGSAVAADGFGRRRRPDWRDPASIVLLVALVAAFLGFRRVLVAAVPGLSGLYARLGLPVNVRGLDFRDVGATRDSVDGASGLVVSGQIVNPGGVSRPLPALRFTLYDGQGREVGGWSANVEHPPLAGGEAAPFRSRLADPPEAARQLQLRFEDAAERKS